MARGTTSPEGQMKKTQNGYWMKKTAEGWKYMHRLIAEQKLGRPLKVTERVNFLDGNRENYHPDNLEIVVSRKRVNLAKRAIYRIDKMQMELADLRSALEEALNSS